MKTYKERIDRWKTPEKDKQIKWIVNDYGVLITMFGWQISNLMLDRWSTCVVYALCTVKCLSSNTLILYWINLARAMEPYTYFLEV